MIRADAEWVHPSKIFNDEISKVTSQNPILLADNSSHGMSIELLEKESLDLKVPLFHTVTFNICGNILRTLILIVLIAFQAIGAIWIYVMSEFYNQPITFFTYMFAPSVLFCSILEILFDAILTTLVLIQIIQRGTFKLVYKSRILFNICVASYLAHLIVFLPFVYVAGGKVIERLEEDMTRELNVSSSRRLYHPYRQLWINTQNKYECCGFGRGMNDYEALSHDSSCCPTAFTNCSIENIYRRNCFSAEIEFGTKYLKVAKILFGSGIPFAILLYLGLRYFRAFWKLRPQSNKAHDEDSINSALREDESLNPPDYSADPPPTPIPLKKVEGQNLFSKPPSGSQSGHKFKLFKT